MITFTETSYREYKIPIGDDVLTVNEAGYQAIQYLLKQAKREAYKDAHDTCAKFGTVQSCLGYLCHQAEEIK